MRWLWLLALSGCMTDSDGDVCSAPPFWIGGDGPSECPEPGGGSTHQPTYHSFGDPSTIASDQRARVALTSSEAGTHHIALVWVDVASGAANLPVELVEGEDARLAGVPDHAYLVWRQATSTFGAVVDAAGQLGEPVELGTAHITPIAVGPRFLITETTYQQPALARWIEADGKVGDPFAVTTGAEKDLAVAASDTTVGLAYRRDDVLYARTLDEQGLSIEREIATKTSAPRIVVVGDTLYVGYTGTFNGTYGVHVTRVEADGLVADHRMTDVYMHGPSQLVYAGDRLFAIGWHDDYNYVDIFLYAYELTLDGAFVPPSRFLGKGEVYVMPMVTAIGRDLLVVDAGSQVTATLVDDADKHEPIIVAETYELDEGCSTGGGAGWLVIVALAGLSRCSRRSSRSPG